MYGWVEHNEDYDVISKITPHLYLSSFDIARKDYILERHEITAILDVGNHWAYVDKNKKPKNYLGIPVDDDDTQDIAQYFPKCFAFIAAHKTTLVHCRMGISRSATIVIAFLMHRYDWSLVQSMAHVLKCRSMVQPNQGFRKQLKIYERSRIHQESDALSDSMALFSSWEQ